MQISSRESVRGRGSPIGSKLQENHVLKLLRPKGLEMEESPRGEKSSKLDQNQTNFLITGFSVGDFGSDKTFRREARTFFRGEVENAVSNVSVSRWRGSGG